jgi:hypothetical protein
MKRPSPALSLLAVFVSATAWAVPAPRLPLPECQTVDGRKVGPCPRESRDVYGWASGTFSVGSTINAYVEPEVPVCVTWGKYTDIWSPSPCYPGVAATTVVGCGYISLVDDTWRETTCNSALYQSPYSQPSPLFSSGDSDGYTCGGQGDFWTFVWGGPYTQKETLWMNRGPDALGCGVTFHGERPDGLWGPTWVKLSATVYVAETGWDTSSGFTRSAEYYVPIDGDLRDLGPLAAFNVERQAAGEVRFRNDSVHTFDEPMTFSWDFGDGTTSAVTDPVHRYREPGRYQVRLTATDASGDEDVAPLAIDVKFELLVDLEVPDEPVEVDAPATVTFKVTNPFATPVERFTLQGATGLRYDPDHVAVLSGPSPTLPTTLAPQQELNVVWQVSPRISGNTTLRAVAQGSTGGRDVTNEDSARLTVPALLDVTLETSVDASTRVGDSFEVTAVLTNEDRLDIENIKSEPLELIPVDLLDPVSGPTTARGTDPRVDPSTLAPWASERFTWVVEAVSEGAVTLRALISGRDPHTGELFYRSKSKRIAIGVAALDITDLRYQPGSPVPGDFGNVRGTITNIGSIDITDLDFGLTSNPELQVVDRLLEELDPAVSPRIALLEPEESREFMIPAGMVSDAGGLAAYTFDLTFTGVAEVNGQPADVEHTARGSGGLDLSPYWTDILAEVKRSLLDLTIEVIDGINDWGDQSTLAGVTVGGGQGVLTALQKMGDGVLTVNDVLGEASGDGGERLTDDGKAIVGAVREYLHTTSAKKMMVDLADAQIYVTVEGVGVFANWMRQVDQAQARGDLREVSRLISEPGAQIAVGFGAEAAGAQLFSRLIRQPLIRDTMHALKRGPDDIDDVPFDLLRERELADLKDMPTGVRITGETVARAGITPDEHGWMIDMAKEHGVAFFVRPRPEDAARFASQGFNAKPMAIKLKSVNDIDTKWLGYDDYADSQGLVVLREPRDPFPAMMEAVERGELEWGGAEIDAIIARYNKRRAEWASKDELLAKLNGGDGFDIQRYGKTIKTKVTLDSDGLLRFTHNNQPVYSDIDLLQIARPDGKPIPKELHDLIAREAGFGFDSQHGDTLSTSDFPDWETAARFAQEYGTEHKRGGDPLVIIQPDVTTLGYVDELTIPAAGPTGSGYDLYGSVQVSYEGAGIP